MCSWTCLGIPGHESNVVFSSVVTGHHIPNSNGKRSARLDFRSSCSNHSSQSNSRTTFQHEAKNERLYVLITFPNWLATTPRRMFLDSWRLGHKPRELATRSSHVSANWTTLRLLTLMIWAGRQVCRQKALWHRKTMTIQLTYFGSTACGWIVVPNDWAKSSSNGAQDPLHPPEKAGYSWVKGIPKGWRFWRCGGSLCNVLEQRPKVSCVSHEIRRWLPSPLCLHRSFYISLRGVFEWVSLLRLKFYNHRYFIAERMRAKSSGNWACAQTSRGSNAEYFGNSFTETDLDKTRHFDHVTRSALFWGFK